MNKQTDDISDEVIPGLSRGRLEGLIVKWQQLRRDFEETMPKVYAAVIPPLKELIEQRAEQDGTSAVEAMLSLVSESDRGPDLLGDYFMIAYIEIEQVEHLTKQLEKAQVSLCGAEVTEENGA